MLGFPNCKINLGLYITEKRADGYHNLETVFYPIALKDALEIVRANGASDIHLSGKAIGGDPKNNLVWKAFELIKQIYPHQATDITIYLHKTIPMGAGLGGGSSDGALMLQLLNNHYKLGLTAEHLAEMALQLGSDCPFFIYNTPQFATGRGEQMTPVELDLSNFTIQLICPDVHISTAKAFSMLTPCPAPFDLRNISSIAVRDWKEQVSNDFEQPVFSEYPELKDIKKQLYNGGALYASLSGSGSAIYGIFPKGAKTTIQSSLSFEEHII